VLWLIIFFVVKKNKKMTKKIIIIISLVIVILIVLIIFYFLNNMSEKISTSAPSNPPPTTTPSESLTLEPTQPTDQKSPPSASSLPSSEESYEKIDVNILKKEFEELLNLNDKEYNEIFDRAQKIVNFPIKYIKSSKGYKLKIIEAWQGDTENVIATYQNENKTFVLDEGTIFFNVDYMGLPIEIELAKNKKGYWWDIIQEDGSHQRTLYFDYLEKDGIDYLYTIKSSDLTKEELIDIANLIITQE